MALTERTALAEVSMLPEQNIIQVRWDNLIERDGVEVSRQPHRKAYMAEQKADFLAEVEGGAAYAAAMGW